MVKSFLLALVSLSFIHCVGAVQSSLLTTRPELLFPGAIEITDEPVVKSVLTTLQSRQKVFIFDGRKPEAWSAVNKSYIAHTLLQLTNSPSALCFVVAHELGHLELHQGVLESHDTHQQEFEADAFAINQCINGGYSGSDAVMLLKELEEDASTTERKKLLNERAAKITQILEHFSYGAFELPSPEFQDLKRKFIQ